MMKIKLSPEECNQLKQLKDNVSKELDLLLKIDREEKQKKNEEIISLIKYYRTLTEEVETRRNRIYNFTLQFLVICLTAIGILLSLFNGKSNLFFWGLLIILITFIVFSVLIIIIYEFQSGFRYPFLNLKEYGNKWKWFYYGNQYILKINTNPISRKCFNQTLEPYLNGLNEFIKNYRKENIDKEISDNIQQLYLLQVHNYYKNRFYLQLTRIRLYLIKFIPIIIVIIVIIYVINFLL